jgi:hypothetical protein
MSGFIHDAPPINNVPYTLWLTPNVGIVKATSSLYDMQIQLHSLKGF